MVDEERLAEALSAHIDALLAGRPLSLEDSPEELKQLVGLADQLAAVDLPPRPAFGQQIKHSLLGQHGGGNGSLARLGNWPGLLVLGLVVLTGLIGMGALTATLGITLLLSQHDRLPTSTPHVPAPMIAPTPGITPLPLTPTPTLESTATAGSTLQPLPAATMDQLIPRGTPPTLPFRLRGKPTGAPADNHTESSHGNSDGGEDRHPPCDDCDDD